MSVPAAGQQIQAGIGLYFGIHNIDFVGNFRHIKTIFFFNVLGKKTKLCVKFRDEKSTLAKYKPLLEHDHQHRLYLISPSIPLKRPP